MAATVEHREGAGGELLSAMSPSQILPNHIIAVRRWRRANEKAINEKIRRNIKEKRGVILACRDVEFKRNKKIPLDVLTKDWLENIGGTDELRMYLIENCLPSLVLGLESLLVEVGKKPDNFNPLNYLAQHLMRNNPRYNQSIGSTPYMKGLNEVKEELQTLVSKLRQNKAARITSDARKRRYERQSKEAIVPDELDRRAEVISASFNSWSFGEETIPHYKIQRAMRSFMDEKVPKFNDEMKSVCKYLLPLPHDDRKDAINVTAYTQYIIDHVTGWPIGAFNALLEHIDSCAKAVPIGDQRQKIQSSLTSLFRTIDKEKTQSLDRNHILTLIKEFYKTVPVNMKKYITNPLDWSDRDTVYSPTPLPSIMTTPYCSTSQSVLIEIAKEDPTPEIPKESPEKNVQLPPEPEPEPEKPAAVAAVVEGEEEGEAEVEIELRHDIEAMGAERPSSMAQPREPEIDPRINISQFLYVTEKLLGEDPHPRALTALSEFLEDSFQETPQQRQSRQLDEKLAAKQHMMTIKINDLFDEWDVDNLGFLDRTEILEVMSQWNKNSTKSYNIEMSKQICMAVESVERTDLLRQDFMNLCQTFHKVLDSDDYMDRLLDFVSLVVKTQREDLRRERKRRRWLQVMTILPKVSGSDHSMYFRSFFDIIEKDFGYHGNGRLINAYIALVENDPDADEEDEDKTLLRYIASTANDQSILIGRTLYANQKCISNQVRRSGKAVYINQIRNNNQVHLWAMDRWAVDEDRDGAFLVLPLKTDKDRIVGVVGVDTLLSSTPTQFLPHEITFIQNAVRSLSNGFSFLDARHKFQRTLISLLEVIPRKEPNVKTVSCYVVEPLPQVPSGPVPEGQPVERVLRCILVLNPKTSEVEVQSGASRAVIHRSDSSFRYNSDSDDGPPNANVDRKSLENPDFDYNADSETDIIETETDTNLDYLFTCLEKQEDQQQRALGTDHLAMCILGPDDQPFLVMDLDTGKDNPLLKPAQVKSIRNLYSKLVVVFQQLLEEVEKDEKTFLNENEEKLPDDLKFALRFEKMILDDLKKRMSNMDVGALSEMKSYKEPPAIIATVIQVTMLILDVCPEEELQEWSKIKGFLNSDLLKKLGAFNPLSKDNKIDIHKINDRLKGVTSTDVKKGGSLPSYLLYQWIIDVISIIRVSNTS